MNVMDNKLYAGEMQASEIAKKFGTPVYVYDEEAIRFKYRELFESISYLNLKIHYSMKANSNLGILAILREEGANVSAVSPGEAMIALKAGFKPEQIMFAPASATDEEMKFAISRKIRVICDSASQLERYGKLNPRSKAAIRINTAIGAGNDRAITGGQHSKFGIWVGYAEQAKAVADKYGLKITGLHHHTSGTLDAGRIIDAINMLLAAAKSFNQLEFINLGGGIGIPYKPDEKPIDLKEFGEKISKLMAAFSKNYGKELQFILEPGRYLVAEAGALLCRVTAIKSTPRHKFACVDTGFNHLPGQASYPYHEIIAAENTDGIQKEKVIVAGNMYDSQDILTTEDRELPALKEGDLLAIMNSGAYGYSMSSNYNLRPRPAEILVKGKKATVIRKAESLKDIAK